MDQNLGHIVQSTIRPATSADTFAVFYQNEALGGFHSYTSLSERDNIPTQRRKEGMRAYVTGTTYYLSGGTTNSNWIIDNVFRNTGIGQGLYNQRDSQGIHLIKTLVSNNPGLTISSDNQNIYFNFSGTITGTTGGASYISNDAYNYTTWSVDTTSGATRQAIANKINSIDNTFQYYLPVSAYTKTYINDAPYGDSWNGDTISGASRNAIYDIIQTIGLASGNIAYVDSSGGNDNTAQIGNLIKPFKTIGRAISAIMTGNTGSELPSAELRVRSGSYPMTDADCPQGIKVSGSKYNVTIDAGALITYAGTYGFFISDNTTEGNFNCDGRVSLIFSSFSGVVDSVNNYAVNIGCSSISKVFNCNYISGPCNILRIGTCTSTGVSITVNERIGSTNGTVLFFDTGSRGVVLQIGLLQSTTTGADPVKINNPTQIKIANIIQSQVYANIFGGSQTCILSIVNETNGNIIIQNNAFTAYNTTGAFKNIYFKNTISNYNNVSILNCFIKNRQDSTLTRSGNAIYADNNLSIKVINTYGDTDSGTPSGVTLTNLTTVGSGFFFEPNL